MKKLLVSVLVGASLAACANQPVPTTEPAPTTTSTTLPTAAAPIVPTEEATVLRVVDGDTVVMTSSQRVRVLGLSSCERSTPQGPVATARARELLPVGATVQLRRESGVDLDRYGRALRYVGLSDGSDLAELMVVGKHSGVYEGGDAAPAVIARLRTLDADGRDCS